jgi:hypothetical protein
VDPNLDEARAWMKKCHPKLASSRLIRFPPLALFGYDGYELPYVASLYVPGQSVDWYVDTIAHEGLHEQRGPAFGESHEQIYQDASRIRLEYINDPDGKKCDKCKK